MSADGPLEFHRRWSRLKPPLRPDAQIVSVYRRAIVAHYKRVLLLGVTADLADLGETLVAVDRNTKMIAHAWAGDNDRRKAVHGDWLKMPLTEREFTAVIGDGVLAAIGLASYATFFSQLGKLLLPSARLALRLYERPERCESVAKVRQETMGGKIKGFHAFKWRLAMALAAESDDPAVPVARIFEMFEREFPDRGALAAATGWDLDEIGEIDAYAHNPMIYQFPTRSEILAHIPDNFRPPRFIASGDYELSERCPILIAEFRA